MGMVRAVGGWMAATVLLGLAATALSSVMVAAMLIEVGADLGAGDVAGLVAADLAGFGPLYGGLIAVALAIAFLAGAGVTRLLKPLRPLVFAAAGGVAMAVMLVLMEQVFFGVQMVAGARTLTGFLLQTAAGAAAGLVYAALTPPPRRA
ncbi:MAG: hypothetical protein ACLFQ5_04070 [Oceanicaulis sp.]